MDKLVIIKRVNGIEDLYVESKLIAIKTKNNHKSILDMIYRYMNLIKEFGKVAFQMRPLESGQKEKIAYLNEQQTTFLMTLLKNSPEVVKFKFDLVKEFFRMRELLREKLSSDWKATRVKGKLCRRNETDVIMAKLIPLAISQGSKNAGKLYMTYSKLVNKCVGIPSNSREKATKRVLDVIYNLENLIEHVISEEVDKETYYKDIYQICKGKCNLMVELSYLPPQRLIA
ncbi:Rha family transcriptional regulator [Clostridium kluyveri]|uniref:Uncharacterized protein n=1 Tax=Clostridium kluyveri TaxID=1534 RepID=A0A1L5F8U0_CLOKL|nr:Rha family transcriptional regulator [Clostridium kluyveri]APM39393.1 hypothetical protein BS101_11895 [Clostridium kluyveri]